ncbi:bifunctional hydroxymethylpyrimidine kinase/phosphomethylpyrimidine kinase [Alkaliphilus peptidifermentans]|uniref:Hydroxymethylpyrimidine/phosphomethylpyrimidine kinase n=1 Tax=Alkaliphilus peptidifermentans DSM 18978 TaxID=1120976 RepID=A0A1G5FUE0_9FIRM|nr:bifunctional hydroxymethylpyrimidine kinase/phosphomethylpyrimidine kinase [Alkaliphilus peptidifermentans]SCY42863.1 hydroxymethylpyrimidine/phosphomethylpyrimidine kinase [Alkaliphilus peptidifermentans DSM 18978]
MKNVLTIAGSDSCGGAGIQADLKTFSAHGVYGMSVITAVTAQNTQGVFAVEDISAELIKKQIEAIYDDIKVDAVKIGMVSKIETITTISETLQRYYVKNIVVDPVMISKSGYHLLQPEAKTALINNLLPLATVVTPNLMEAEVITGVEIKNIENMKKAALLIHKMGPQYILIKGGHLEDEATDLLYDGDDFYYYPSPRIQTKNTHGTGCTLSSAIASNLARGLSINLAIEKAKEYITIAIQNSFSIGKGVGPTHHFHELYSKVGLID